METQTLLGPDASLDLCMPLTLLKLCGHLGLFHAVFYAGRLTPVPTPFHPKLNDAGAACQMRPTLQPEPL